MKTKLQLSSNINGHFWRLECPRFDIDGRCYKTRATAVYHAMRVAGKFKLVIMEVYDL